MSDGFDPTVQKKKFHQLILVLINKPTGKQKVEIGEPYAISTSSRSPCPTVSPSDNSCVGAKYRAKFITDTLDSAQGEEGTSAHPLPFCGSFIVSVAK